MPTCGNALFGNEHIPAGCSLPSSLLSLYPINLVGANCLRVQAEECNVKSKSQTNVVASHTKAQKVPLRWSGHLPLAIRIALSGSDENGRAFSESTQTVGVDRRGARIVTSHPIALGTEVTVENSAVHRIAKAKVV